IQVWVTCNALYGEVTTIRTASNTYFAWSGPTTANHLTHCLCSFVDINRAEVFALRQSAVELWAMALAARQWQYQYRDTEVWQQVKWRLYVSTPRVAHRTTRTTLLPNNNWYVLWRESCISRLDEIATASCTIAHGEAHHIGTNMVLRFSFAAAPCQAVK